jgi:glucose/arabinose dehydrogenase
MKKSILLIVNIVVCVLYLHSCNPGKSADDNSISTDPADIAAGENIFKQYCSGCHNFTQNGIGPQLSGITHTASAAWIQDFIKNPEKVIQSGDDRAQLSYKHYKTVMPSFTNLKNDEINTIIAFLNTHNKVKTPGNDERAIADPIPEKIKVSDLVAQLELVTQIPASSDSGKLPLARITKLDYQPNTEKIFILDLRGKLYTLEKNRALVYFDMSKLKPNFINEPGLATGFGSFAFHPQFAKNGLFYTTHTEKPGAGRSDFNYADSIPVTLQWVLTEWKCDQPASNVFTGKGRELLRVNMVSGLHGLQEITFNPFSQPGDEDYGLLYIGIGDGGCVENGYPFLAHNREKIWGTLLRIDPSGKNSVNGKYGIPGSNPFVKHKNSLGEIYAFGFRNPHRITWSTSGQMFVCNIGHGNIESIDLIKKGNDYGWPIREGRFALDPYGDLDKVYSLPLDDSNYHVAYPVANYDHDEGKAICGGFEYTGKTIPQLKGKFLFGDIPSGRLFYFDMNDVKPGSIAKIKEWKVSIDGFVKKLSELCGNERVDLHFGRDAHGELYLLTKADGKVYKITGARNIR